MAYVLKMVYGAPDVKLVFVLTLWLLLVEEWQPVEVRLVAFHSEISCNSHFCVITVLHTYMSVLQSAVIHGKHSSGYLK